MIWNFPINHVIWYNKKKYDHMIDRFPKKSDMISDMIDREEKFCDIFLTWLIGRKNYVIYFSMWLIGRTNYVIYFYVIFISIDIKNHITFSYHLYHIVVPRRCPGLSPDVPWMWPDVTRNDECSVLRDIQCFYVRWNRRLQKMYRKKQMSTKKKCRKCRQNKCTWVMWYKW